MKAYKIIGTILWTISALMAGIGLVVYFGNTNHQQINIPAINWFIMLFMMSFVMMTPIYLNLLFRDSFWKNQKEMDELRKNLNNSIEQYNAAKEKLINKIIQE